jgi:uncharacterized membrane protein YdjX (TVP38/TMEM64 family)
MTLKRALVLAALLGLASAALIVRPLLQRVIVEPELVSEALRGLGPVAPIAFVLLGSVYSMLPLPRYVWDVAGGYLFGARLGTLLNIATLLLGTTLGFTLGRLLGEPLLERLVPERYTGTWLRFRRMDNLLVWAALFLLPIGDLVAIVAGMTVLPLWKLLLAVLMVSGPTTVLITFLGADLVSIPREAMYVAIPVVVVAAVIAFLSKDRIEKFIYHRILPHIHRMGTKHNDEHPSD